MQISVTFRNMNSSDSLREYAEEKCEKLKRHLDMPVDVKIVLAKHKYRKTADVPHLKPGLEKG